MGRGGGPIRAGLLIGRVSILTALLWSVGCASGDDDAGTVPDAGASDSVPAATVETDSVSASDSSAAAPSDDVAASTGTESPGGPSDSGDASSEPREPFVPVVPADRPEFERPEHVRGIYLNAWASGSRNRVGSLLELAARTEINAFVIDLKDATGYLSHRSDVPLAAEIGALDEPRIRDLQGLLARLSEAGVYPIARIVIAKDPLLAAARPEWAVRDTTGGVWFDDKGVSWLDMFQQGVWDYHVDLAREAIALGFPEIQWDYVRFPDAPRSVMERAAFPSSNGRTKSQAIREFLGYARSEIEPLGVPMTADVFGVTTLGGDVGIGQVWSRFIDQVDVALPMVYPSHYWRGSYGFDQPNGRPYEIIVASLADALEQSAKLDVPRTGTVRPWLQDFTLGAPAYDGPEVRAQIQATYDVGLTEWILWNPGSRYTEEALAPADGAWDPEMAPIRVGGVIVPAGFRHFVLSFEHPLDPLPGFPLELRLPDLPDRAFLERYRRSMTEVVSDSIR